MAALVPTLWLNTWTAEPLYARLGWQRVGLEKGNSQEVVQGRPKPWMPARRHPEEQQQCDFRQLHYRPGDGSGAVAVAGAERACLANSDRQAQRSLHSWCTGTFVVSTCRMSSPRVCDVAGQLRGTVCRRRDRVVVHYSDMDCIAQGLASYLLKALAQGWVGVNCCGDILKSCAHFERQAEGG
jgi:hypothetical protein